MMFIYSIRASTLRFAGLMILSLALLTGVLVHARADDVAVVSYQYHKIKTEEDRVAFLEQFGWKVKSKTPIEEQEFTIPKQFDRVMLGYNEIQKSQGLDLSRYHHKKVTRYTYEIDNYEGYEGKVYANLILYRDKVIGGDICSAEASPGGFVHG
ncbi:MAG: DUF4830 domain-containing protein, partial [Clostridia bacterium]|nr:DUF4830 domain-containing protein [Clostridia bacterium]